VVTAIVVEGGAMRGIFSAGVLDVFLEEGIGPFDLAVGSSAGACNLSSHLAGQHGRNRRCYVTQMRRREFMSARRFARGGHWMDIDYLWDAFAREDPLDVAAVAASPTTLVVAATSALRGVAVYFEPAAGEMFDVLRASSAVPVLYRTFVALGDEHFTDGGVSAPIPVDEAYRRGARRIVVIRSRPAHFAGPSRLECTLAAAALRNHPALARAFRRYREVYARASAFVYAPPHDCEILELAPEHPFRTSRTTRNVATLDADYARGRVAAMRALPAMRAWMLDRMASAPHTAKVL
jgi:predicted patatin/cPLA2 family phospholipase